ncbi:protein FAM207A [Megalops cyprinoides]|uniref:protein FAM207A n=1 Tax=Megalops cyprinoides TaxID=118141 RepID=UPI001864D416|nr:protein FAM207A [Megalops cyprinoides]
MVGKIKRTRQKLHQAAVKLGSDSGVRSTSLLGQDEAPIPVGTKESSTLFPKFIKTSIADDASEKQTQRRENDNEKRFDVFPSSVFSGTKISPEALVQTLKFEDAPSVTPVQSGAEGKKQQTKKEKMKERRERWLNKISVIKQAKEQQVAQARRRATPVVGDMQPLADALPELSQLVTTSRTSTHRKARVPVKKKPEPTDFSLMKPAQKRKLLDTEISRFSEAVKNPAFKSNSLAAIGEHLRKRLKQEEEQGPS